MAGTCSTVLLPDAVGWPPCIAPVRIPSLTTVREQITLEAMEQSAAAASASISARRLWRRPVAAWGYSAAAAGAAATGPGPCVPLFPFALSGMLFAHLVELDG